MNVPFQVQMLYSTCYNYHLSSSPYTGPQFHITILHMGEGQPSNGSSRQVRRDHQMICILTYTPIPLYILPTGLHLMARLSLLPPKVLRELHHSSSRIATCDGQVVLGSSVIHMQASPHRLENPFALPFCSCSVCHGFCVSIRVALGIKDRDLSL
uniref:Uncharacterized protein n=1 Tax=Triticum urartu TaxID=4572 RepID=A0A8R7U585_TRIUA